MPFVYSSFIDRVNDKPVCCRSGSCEAPTYEYQNIKGIKSLVKVGVINTQDYIDSFRRSSDIHNIINAFLNGDDEILNVKEGFYGDITAIPDNLNEITEFANNSRMYFDSLDPRVKEHFGNDPSKFYEAVTSDTVFVEILNKIYADDKPVESEEVANAE